MPLSQSLPTKLKPAAVLELVGHFGFGFAFSFSGSFLLFAPEFFGILDFFVVSALIVGIFSVLLILILVLRLIFVELSVCSIFTEFSASSAGMHSFSWWTVAGLSASGAVSDFSVSTVFFVLSRLFGCDFLASLDDSTISSVFRWVDGGSSHLIFRCLLGFIVAIADADVDGSFSAFGTWIASKSIWYVWSPFMVFRISSQFFCSEKEIIVIDWVISKIGKRFLSRWQTHTGFDCD